MALVYPALGWAIFGALVIFAFVCGALLARFTLGPARRTAQYQKLFISNVAHELRTPLSIIKTESEVALIDEALPSPLKRIFGEIIEELNRASEIINNLLSLETLTRPERMQFQSIDVAPMLDEVVRRLGQLAHERAIKVTIRKEPGAIVWGNATALEQIMTNLIKNALSYTPAKAHGTVSVTLRPESGMVLFAVQDTGIGIAQEDLQHIFEPFYRADTSRNRKIKKSGSGLGLTIVSEMVRTHHGRIHVRSELKSGTIVSIYLPQGGANKSREKSETSIDYSAPGARATSSSAL